MIKLGRIINFIPSSKNKYLEPLKLPDCIHLTENCKCSVLIVDDCIGEGCTFFKGTLEKSISEMNFNQRLNSLDENRQKQIANIYYGGKMPWKKGK